MSRHVEVESKVKNVFLIEDQSLNSKTTFEELLVFFTFYCLFHFLCSFPSEYHTSQTLSDYADAVGAISVSHKFHTANLIICARLDSLSQLTE